MTSRERIFWEEFIAAYRSFPSIWNTKHPDYRNRHAKQEAFNSLLNLVQGADPDADMHFVHSKINNLRTSFRREYRKQMESKKTARTPADIYQPSLWYFELLRFTATASQKSDDERVDKEEENTSCFDDTASSVDSFEKIEIKNPLDDEESHAEPPLRIDSVIGSQSDAALRKTKRKPVFTYANNVGTHEGNNSGSIEAAPISSRNSPDDEYSIVGKRIAYQLRAMTEDQRLICEKLISDVTFYGRIGRLREDSYVANIS